MLLLPDVMRIVDWDLVCMGPEIIDLCGLFVRDLGKQLEGEEKWLQGVEVYGRAGKRAIKRGDGLECWEMG